VVPSFTKLFTFFAAVLLFSSCAFHTGSFSNSTPLNPQEYKLVGQATGAARVVRVLGLGGIDRQALVYEAKRNLYKNHPIKEGQVLTNVTVDFKRAFYPFWNTTTATITAEVLELRERPTVLNDPEAIYNILYHRGISPLEDTLKIFAIGAKVLFRKGDGYEAGIIKAQTRTKVSIIYLDEKDNARLSVNFKSDVFCLELFGEDETKVPFKIGAEVRKLNKAGQYLEMEDIKTFKIAALGLTHALIRQTDGSLEKVKYENLRSAP
jgi:hypothetical protein